MRQRKESCYCMVNMRRCHYHIPIPPWDRAINPGEAGWQGHVGNAKGFNRYAGDGWIVTPIDRPLSLKSAPIASPSSELFGASWSNESPFTHTYLRSEGGRYCWQASPARGRPPSRESNRTAVLLIAPNSRRIYLFLPFCISTALALDTRRYRRHHSAGWDWPSS